ncbi:MAG: hypothetical protein PHS48_03485 [Bacteroidales bacterium]|nr:hypothetical protein [Bacteroidales bacterium]
MVNHFRQSAIFSVCAEASVNYGRDAKTTVVGQQMFIALRNVADPTAFDFLYCEE